MSVRIQCIKTLQKILEEKIFFTSLKDDFKLKDSAFANFLILTALRRKTAIEKLLSSILTKKIASKDKILNYILLSGSTEILYMETPDYAAINEYVNITKKLSGKFSSSMVNAVLHKVIDHKDEMKNKVALPVTFQKILQPDYSKEQIKKIEQTLLTEAPLDLTPKENPELWASKLKATLFENGTIRLCNLRTNITQLEEYQEGAWWVQDLAASLPVCLTDNLNNKRVLDVCAAPGGKTAQLLAKGAFVTALDISLKRLETLKENISRLKLEKNLTTINADALEYLNQTNDSFDLILLDAPCSATGTFRKHPEVIHIKTLEDVKKQTLLQQKLLEAASKHLLPHGVLIYCTCSISKLEGEKIIEQFLKTHQNFKQKLFKTDKFQKLSAKSVDKNIIHNGVLRTLPYNNENEGGMDAFYAACLALNN